MQLAPEPGAIQFAPRLGNLCVPEAVDDDASKHHFAAAGRDAVELAALPGAGRHAQHDPVTGPNRSSTLRRASEKATQSRQRPY